MICLSVCLSAVAPTQRPETVCERWRASLIEHYGGQPASHHYLPQCDSFGQFNPLQCYGDSSYCWCVDKDGREVPGTRSHDAVKPACEYRSAPKTARTHTFIIFIPWWNTAKSYGVMVRYI